MIYDLNLQQELQRRFDAAYEASIRAAALVGRSKYGSRSYSKAMYLFFSFNGRASALAKLQSDLFFKTMSGVEPGL